MLRNRYLAILIKKKNKPTKQNLSNLNNVVSISGRNALWSSEFQNGQELLLYRLPFSTGAVKSFITARSYHWSGAHPVISDTAGPRISRA